MKALKLEIQPASLISSRIPYTWQSSLTYPIPPPSALLGMAAGVLFRLLGTAEEKAIQIISGANFSAHARLDSPCIIKPFVVSSITKINTSGIDGCIKGKSTDALSRQFIFALKYEIVYLSEDYKIIELLSSGFKFAPVYLGDSESLVTVVSNSIFEATRSRLDSVITTKYFAPLSAFKELQKGGSLFLIHEDMQRKPSENNKKPRNKTFFTLHDYLFPIAGGADIWYPSEIRGILSKDSEVYTVDDESIIRLKSA